MNETFKIRENGFDEIKKQLIIKSISFSLLALSFGTAIVYFRSENKEDLYMSLPFSLPILIIALLFGLRTGFKRQKNIFETYKLVFLENNVTREQANTSTVNIQFEDIKSITKEKQGSYTIKGKRATDVIIIPAQIENFENLEVLFNKIKPVTEAKKTSFQEKYALPITILNLLCMAAVYISMNKILVGICGIIVTFVLSTSFIKIIKNKSVDNKTKTSSYIILVVIASIIAITILKVTSNFQ